ncbi:hypothetical protein OROMI_029520 [Orobanche minor]
MWKRLLSWIPKSFLLEGSTMNSAERKRKTGHGHVDEGSIMDPAEGKKKTVHGHVNEGSTMDSAEGKRKTGHGHVDEGSTMDPAEGKKKRGHGHVDEGSTMDSAEGKRKAGHVALCARVAKKREKIARRLEKQKNSRRFLQSSSSEDSTSSDESSSTSSSSEDNTSSDHSCGVHISSGGLVVTMCKEKIGFHVSGGEGFEYVTRAPFDVQALGDALSRLYPPGTPEYNKRFDMIKKKQHAFEKKYGGGLKVDVKVALTKEGKCVYSSFKTI